MRFGFYNTFYIRHEFEMEPLQYIRIPKKPSWAELNKGKMSKRQRRK